MQNEIICAFDLSADPLYQQLYRHIADEIVRGRLQAGSRLPSRRSLCERLRLSYATVDAALQMLKAEGYIRAEARRGYFVESILPLEPRAIQSPRAPLAPRAPQARFDFSPQAADASLFPYRTWIRLFKETLYWHPELLRKGDPGGDERLRQALTGFLYQTRGLSTPAHRLFIGAGVEYLLGVLFDLIPGDSLIALEDPGYREAYRVATRRGHRTLPLPMDAQGVLPDALEKSKARLCYITPSHQFPLGISMQAARRTALLRWADLEEGRYVIEDDYDSEFRYTSRPLPSLQGMDGDKVIYIGTFSRSLAPSIRMAYMALPEKLALRLEALKIDTGYTVSRFEQHTLASFLEGGHYARHLRRSNKVYAGRCERLCKRLLELEGSQISGNEAGLHFLWKLPEGLSEAEAVSRARGCGIPLRGLHEYLWQGTAPQALVIGFAGIPDQQLDTAAQALLDALRG